MCSRKAQFVPHKKYGTWISGSWNTVELPYDRMNVYIVFLGGGPNNCFLDSFILPIWSMQYKRQMAHLRFIVFNAEIQTGSNHLSLFIYISSHGIQSLGRRLAI